MDNTLLLRLVLRHLMMCVINHVAFLYYITRILPRKRPWGPTVCFFAFKILARDILTGTVLLFFFQDAPWTAYVQFFASLLFIPCSYLALCRLTDQSLLRVGIVCILVEVPIAVGFSLASAVANLVGGHALWEMGPIGWSDSLVPAILFPLFNLLWYLLKPLLLKLRTCTLRPRWLIALVVFLYMTTGSIGSVTHNYNLLRAIIPLAFLYSGLLAAIFYLYIRYVFLLRREAALLQMQRHAAEIHYSFLLSEIKTTQKTQELVNRQMERIVESAATTDSATVARYLDQLRQSYSSLQAGVYCSDWAIDAALCLQAQTYKQLNIPFSCCMQSYQRGRISEKDMFRILLLLSGYGKTSQRVDLRASAVKNQLVLHMTALNAGSCILLKKNLKHFLKKYQGELTIRRKNGLSDLILVLTIR